MHGASTTYSVYENLSKNSFFVAQQKHPPAWLVGVVPVLRVQRYDFSANWQRNRKDFLRKIRKKRGEGTIITERRGNTPYYIIYRGREKDSPPAPLQERGSRYNLNKERGTRSSERTKGQRKREMPPQLRLLPCFRRTKLVIVQLEH